jgi:nitrous oxidase accessory protein NosD
MAAMLLVGARQASAATLNVCQSGCPYTQLAPALATAQDGDTIKIAPGTYAGGVTIDVSVKLVGAGRSATVISGGGPVLTIGVPFASSEPTVTIDGISVTGGVTVGNVTPSSGRGGGIYIPRAAGPSTGATVTIRDSAIRGNSVAPSEAIESDDPCCPFSDLHP